MLYPPLSPWLTRGEAFAPLAGWGADTSPMGAWALDPLRPMGVGGSQRDFRYLWVLEVTKGRPGGTGPPQKTRAPLRHNLSPRSYEDPLKQWSGPSVTEDRPVS